MKLVLPVAGYGKRLRPHTWSKPKPLVSVAGKPVLAHFLDSLDPVEIEEVVFIIGYLGDQVEAYVAERYPDLPSRYVVQEELTGQSHAIWLAREGLRGPTLVAFVDTLIEADFSSLGDESAIWAKEVEDPRRFGVVEFGADGWVQRLVEKPENPKSNLAVVGFYFFPQAERLIAAIEQQLAHGAKLKGEYYLAEAINLMLDDGMQMRAATVAAWNDCGTPQAILDTNRFLLDHGRDNTAQVPDREGLTIEPPVYVDPTAEVTNSVIGPHTSLGPSCIVDESSIRDSIVEAEAQIRNSSISNSIVGRGATVVGAAGSLNIGDAAAVTGTP